VGCLGDDFDRTAPGLLDTVAARKRQFAAFRWGKQRCTVRVDPCIDDDLIVANHSDELFATKFQ
jgi:hypothetical protein